MSLRDDLQRAVLSGDAAAVERLVASSPRSVRHVAGMLYRPEAEVRAGAARALVVAARHHPQLMASVIRRLIWAMNDESGTNAATAPEALQLIAAEQPELLVPVVPDLLRLAADPALRDGIGATLRTLSTHCPGLVGRHLCEAIEERIAPSRQDELGGNSQQQGAALGGRERSGRAARRR